MGNWFASRERDSVCQSFWTDCQTSPPWGCWALLAGKQHPSLSKNNWLVSGYRCGQPGKIGKGLAIARDATRQWNLSKMGLFLKTSD
ncbi:hypothetical protein RRG08_033652 [Elysia crispata]|uniref:Uncharacterized protein n=1 Tax=Elysia crispata TaxID=231223 RepID=A0AAE1B726_9GAST|nr:hypothetical protein RRG08_033652 [Elysia crispata]